MSRSAKKDTIRFCAIRSDLSPRGALPVAHHGWWRGAAECRVRWESTIG